MELYLLALIPPSNIAHKVRELQQVLFSRCGLASALALPAHIPLGFLPAGAEIPSQSVLQSASLSAPVLTCAQPVLDHNVFYWTLTPQGSIRAFRKKLQEVTGPMDSPPGTPFPPFPGFYLACGQGIESQNGDKKWSPEEVLADLQTPVGLHFPLLMLSCLLLRTLISPEPALWWQGVTWQEIRRIRLRKSGRKTRPVPED